MYFHGSGGRSWARTRPLPSSPADSVHSAGAICMALASATASLAMLGRAAVQRLRRERERARAELVVVLERVDDEVSDLETGELIDVLLGDNQTVADVILHEV
jgi:uncharacterized protein YdaL